MAEDKVHHELRGRVKINGKAVRNAREAREWRKSVVAGHLNVSEKTLERYEAGTTDPHWLDAARLAVLLDLAPADLFFRSA